MLLHILTFFTLFVHVSGQTYYPPNADSETQSAYYDTSGNLFLNIESGSIATLLPGGDTNTDLSNYVNSKGGMFMGDAYFWLTPLEVDQGTVGVGALNSPYEFDGEFEDYNEVDKYRIIITSTSVSLSINNQEVYSYTRPASTSPSPSDDQTGTAPAPSDDHTGTAPAPSDDQTGTAPSPSDDQSSTCQGDLDDNGVVNGDDMTIVANNFGCS